MTFSPKARCQVMMDWLRRRRIGLLAGVVLFAAGFYVITFDPTGLVESWREQAFDVLETTFPRSPILDRVVVVDIDRTSFERKRSWPWPREDIAALIEAIAACHPAVIAVDILLTDSAQTHAGASPAEDNRLRRRCGGRRPFSALCWIPTQVTLTSRVHRLGPLGPSTRGTL